MIEQNRKTELNICRAKKLMHSASKRPRKYNCRIDRALRIACEYFNVSKELIDTKTRKREVVLVRQIVMAYCYNNKFDSQETIAYHIGGKEHATVIHSVKTINNLCETDKRFKAQMDELEEKLKNI